MTFNWDDEKNEKLKTERNISFEEIILCISENKILSVLEHPNNEKYPNQYIYLIEYMNYVYVVPFVRKNDGSEIFLKTIFPSRKYTKNLLQREGENDE